MIVVPNRGLYDRRSNNQDVSYDAQFVNALLFAWHKAIEDLGRVVDFIVAYDRNVHAKSFERPSIGRQYSSRSFFGEHTMCSLSLHCRCHFRNGIKKKVQRPRRMRAVIVIERARSVAEVARRIYERIYEGIAGEFILLLPCDSSREINDKIRPKDTRYFSHAKREPHDRGKEKRRNRSRVIFDGESSVLANANAALLIIEKNAISLTDRLSISYRDSRFYILFILFEQ